MVANIAAARQGGRFAKVPVLAGTNAQEGRIFEFGQSDVNALLQSYFSITNAKNIPALQAHYAVGNITGYNTGYDQVSQLFTVSNSTLSFPVSFSSVNKRETSQYYNPTNTITGLHLPMPRRALDQRNRRPGRPHMALLLQRHVRKHPRLPQRWRLPHLGVRNRLPDLPRRTRQHNPHRRTDPLHPDQPATERAGGRPVGLHERRLGSFHQEPCQRSRVEQAGHLSGRWGRGGVGVEWHCRRHYYQAGFH